MKKILKILLLIICICSFCFFAYKIINHIVQQKENQSLQDDLTSIAIIKESQKEEKQENNKITPIEVDFKALKQKSKDIVAWIFCENTPINYPIVQSKDNEYYLRRLLNGKYNIAGTIFMDYRNYADFSDFNTIIYGHNMNDGTMFGTLQKYKEQNYYNEHKTMYLFTEKKNYEIKLFASYTIGKNDIIYDLKKSDELKRVEEIREKSYFKSDIEISDNHIITLSTCSYDYDGARFIVMGILSEI